MLRRIVRRTIDVATACSYAHRWRHPKGSLLVLTYHRVLPRAFEGLESIEPGMYVHDDTFAEQLEWLRKAFDVVALPDWIRWKRAGEPVPDRACAITFDDGWRDNYIYAFPLLKARSVPATVFAVSNLIGTERRMWPDRLARVLRKRDASAAALDVPSSAWLARLLRDAGADTGEMDAERTSRIVACAKQYPDAQICAHLDAIEPRLDLGADREPPDLLSWPQLERMLASNLVSLGSHTRNHTRLLAGMPAPALVDEVVGSKEQLEAATGRPVEVFCYPNGDTSADAEALVRAHYGAACVVQRGWNGRDADVHRLRRITVHEGRSGTRCGFIANLSA